MTPLHDWQFYVVSILAAAGVLTLARPYLPSRQPRTGACPNCASGSAAARPKRTEVTVEGKGLS